MSSIEVDWKFTDRSTIEHLKKKVAAKVINANTLEGIGNAMIDIVESKVPLDTGRLRRSAHIDSIDVNSGIVKIAYSTPYAEDVYEGVLPNGEPMNFHTPGTKDHWDADIKAGGEDYKELKDRAREIIKRNVKK